jgi:hypothetical protein
LTTPARAKSSPRSNVPSAKATRFPEGSAISTGSGGGSPVASASKAAQRSHPMRASSICRRSSENSRSSHSRSIDSTIRSSRRG